RERIDTLSSSQPELPPDRAVQRLLLVDPLLQPDTIPGLCRPWIRLGPVSVRQGFEAGSPLSDVLRIVERPEHEARIQDRPVPEVELLQCLIADRTELMRLALRRDQV